MKKPKHNIIPNDWPLLERVINEIDISLSEAHSQADLHTDSLNVIIESIVDQHAASLVSMASAVSAALVGLIVSEASQASVQSAIQSRVLVLESEVSVIQQVHSYITEYGVVELKV